jgi:uncharacterized GH25 family protein
MPAVQVFGNVSRAYEPPLILELTAPGQINGDLSKLKPQRAWQFELGTRGDVGERFAWTFSLYDIELKDEIQNVNVQPFPGAFFTIPRFQNIKRSRHSGVEVGFNLLTAKSLVQVDDALRLNTAYTFSRFVFVNNPNFNNNDIPGAPAHYIQTALRYHHPSGFWFGPWVESAPTSYFVNSQNTAKAPSHTLFNIVAGYKPWNGELLFQARNLANKGYVAAVVVDDANGASISPATVGAFMVGYGGSGSHLKREKFMKTRLRFRLAIGSLFVLWLTEPAFAHDGWIEVPAIVEKGQPVTIALMLGNHTNEHKSYRLAGKWNPKFTKLMVIEPSGMMNDITSALTDLGEDEENTGPKGPKGFHIATFTPKTEGVHIVLAREEQVLQHGDEPRFRSVRSARSAFTALRTPRVMEGKKSAGFGSIFAIDNLMEIVPVSNPIAVTQDDRVTLELRYKGKPFPNQIMSIVGRLKGFASVQDLTTDEKGQVRITAGAADSYLVRVKFDERSERKEGQYDLSFYEATYVFQVFNRP